MSNNNVKRRVEIMRSTGLNGLNRRLQLRNPKVQYYMSWFTAHEIGLRLNLWLSILFIHSHFIEINRRFTRCSFICYMLILNNINSIWTTDVYLPDRRCVNLIYMLIQSWSEKQVLASFLMYWEIQEVSRSRDRLLYHIVKAITLSIIQFYQKNNLTIC